MYSPTRNYSFLFFPPPYNFLAPPASFSPGQIVPEDVLQPSGRGLGCPDCGGTCGGLGQTGEGLFGTGLFVSADPSTWGVGEWVTIGLGAFVAISAVTTAQSAGRTVQRAYRRVRS